MRGFTLSALLLACRAAAQKTAVSDTLFSNLTRYAAFASAAYSSDCTGPPYGAVVVQYINNDTTDTQATFFRDDTNEEFIMAFRGTSDVQDFLTDLDQTLVSCDSAQGISCGNCTCEQGYLTQYDSVQDVVASAIDSNLSSYPSYSLIVTGHSLGGGVASIAGTALKGLGYSLDVYTYGQPRTGDPTYADYVDSVFGGQGGTMYRATHKNDGVPQIPAQSDGYRHHHTEYWQSVDPPSANITYECTGQEPQDCNQSEIGYGIGNDGIGINAAHLEYFGVSIGNPLTPNAACGGTIT